MVIFTILTVENWDDTMFLFARERGYIAIYFFTSLIVVGVLIFLNLFLAILLENFEVPKEDDGEVTVREKIMLAIVAGYRWLRDWCKERYFKNDRTVQIEAGG